ncbi:hypothetical protein [Methanoregula sp.]|uniref:hypothetical protein n=1 Tax=Methanoregula sp. TaxID=2052170 RepID=UPI003C5E4645
MGYLDKIKETIYNIIKNISYKAMPNFSSLDETELILLLEYALLDVWNNNYNIQYLSSLKMHKIMYDVSEREDLPITRSWYMLGNNIHQREIVRLDFGRYLFNNPENVSLNDGGIFDISQLIRNNIEVYSEFIRCIKSVINDTNIVMTDSWNYRRWLYREKAPRKFSLCYQASLEYLAFLARFDNDFYIRSKFVIDNCNEVTTNLHKSILQIEDFIPFFEILIEFTDTVEDAILKSSLKIRDNSFISSDLEYLSEQQEIFRDTVWKPFAKIIAIETVKGPRKEEIIEQYRRDLEDLSEVKRDIIENSNKAKELELYLTKNDFNQMFPLNDETKKTIIEVGNIIQRG